MEKRSSKIEPELKPKNTEELIKAYREVFSKSDKRGEGYVHLREVPALLKILGVRCSEQEISDLFRDKVIKSDNPTKIDFKTFLTIVQKKESARSMRQELLESYQLFDKNKIGLIPVNDLRRYLISFGIAMNEEEIEVMLKESDPQDGFVNYVRFIDKLLGMP